MTNLEKIKTYSAEDLAPMLVRCETFYDRDDGYEDIYTSPSGGKYYFEEDAVKDTINWLNEDIEMLNTSRKNV